MKLVHVYINALCLVVLGLTQIKGMHQPLPENIPHTYLNRIVVNSLKNKSTAVFFDHRHETISLDSYEDQKLFTYPIEFAKQEINTSEKMYALLNSEGQAEYRTLFKDAIANITKLTKSDSQPEDLQNYVNQSYSKLHPLVWRVHLLWLLRLKNAELFGDALASIFNCAPCRQDTLRALCALSLAAWYYYTVLLKMPWPEHQALASFFPFICLISALYDLVITPLNQYSHAQEFIREKFKKYTAWKKITDDLAHTMEDTYQPL